MAKDHVSINRTYWNDNAGDWVASGERHWAGDAEWGIWLVPEADLRLFPEDIGESRAIELGCGTGYVSGWMTRRGASVTAIDISENQLATARRLAAEHGAEIEFLHGSAEQVDKPDASFDFAISEYGAAIWCDPSIWIPEAHRLLKPGGRLAFLGNHPLTFVATPPSGAACDRQMHFPYRDLHRMDWSVVEIDPGGIEFNRTFADWLALFRNVGFEVEDYQEIFAPLDASGSYHGIDADWAKDFPSEQVWKLRKL
ncbi:MAG: class I SAM-dependent methyltransferase [Pseudomonadota bacterium]